MSEFQKDLHISSLLDIYGSLLSEKQRDFMDLYYNEDFSLTEISELRDITRQGARDGIKHGEQKLREFEDALGLAKKTKSYYALCAKISELATEIRLSSKQSRSAELAFEIEKLITKYKDLF